MGRRGQIRRMGPICPRFPLPEVVEEHTRGRARSSSPIHDIGTFRMSKKEGQGEGGGQARRKSGSKVFPDGHIAPPTNGVGAGPLRWREVRKCHVYQRARRRGGVVNTGRNRLKVGCLK